MKLFSAVIIFTKDRPSLLLSTLDSIKKENIPIIVLDDSYYVKNRIKNRKNIEKYSFATYHGKKEQQVFYSKDGIDRNLLIEFANCLGSKGWNLGYSRNYALILSKSLKLKKVLFMDDDIIVEDKGLIAKTFSLLNRYDFVGAKITGMLDDSIVGYIVRELNEPAEEYFSGGFIAFRPLLISEYFINLYNEDWVWLYFHQIKHSVFRWGEVRQLPYDNFKNAYKKVVSQEVGEVIVDGIRDILPKQSLLLLKKDPLWKRMLSEKQDYYEYLKNLSLKENREDLYRILCIATDYSAKLQPRLFSTIFYEYFAKRRRWIKLLNAL